MTNNSTISKPISQFRLVKEIHGTKNLMDDKWILEMIRKAAQKPEVKGAKNGQGPDDF